jgi:hypothetical protein
VAVTLSISALKVLNIKLLILKQSYALSGLIIMRLLLPPVSPEVIHITSYYGVFFNPIQGFRDRTVIYCASVNLRLNPKFVLDVGKVFATNGLFIV